MLPGLGGDPRQMAMMMRKLGIEVREVEDVQEVVVRTASRDYVFAKASVSVMKAQGVETWQVSGKPRIVERGAAPSASASTASAPSAAAPAAKTGSAQVPVPNDAPTAYEPSGEDVALVARETGKPAPAARQALVETGGDLAEAILRLSQA